MSHKLESSRSPNYDRQGMLLPIPALSVSIVKVILHEHPVSLSISVWRELWNYCINSCYLKFNPDEFCGHKLMFGHNWKMKLTENYRDIQWFKKINLVWQNSQLFFFFVVHIF